MINFDYPKFYIVAPCLFNFFFNGVETCMRHAYISDNTWKHSGAVVCQSATREYELNRASNCGTRSSINDPVAKHTPRRINQTQLPYYQPTSACWWLLASIFKTETRSFDVSSKSLRVAKYREKNTTEKKLTWKGHTQHAIARSIRPAVLELSERYYRASE